MFVALIALGLAVTPSRAEASAITCSTLSSPAIQTTFDSGIACFGIGSVTGTPTESDVAALFGSTWVNQGELTDDGVDNMLAVELTTGSWGVIPVGGSWTMDPSFWGTWGRAVVTFRLADGEGNADWYFFEVTPYAGSGTFHIDGVSGTGSILSTISLWSSDVPVPEPGSMFMLGTGLLIAAALIRRSAPKRR